MLILILFGPPGSGKGTQAANIVQRYELMHISTGDLLREEKANKTPLGLEAQRYMDKGDLVPDEVVINMISSRIDNNKGVKGIVFDGFPRTVAQAEALDRMLNERGEKVERVLSLKVSEEVLTDRLLKRGELSGRADDRDVSIIKNRVVEYEAKTAPVADYYQEKGLLKNIPGEGSIDDIFILLSYQIDQLV